MHLGVVAKSSIAERRGDKDTCVWGKSREGRLTKRAKKRKIRGGKTGFGGITEGPRGRDSGSIRGREEGSIGHPIIFHQAFGKCIGGLFDSSVATGENSVKKGAFQGNQREITKKRPNVRKTTPIKTTTANKGPVQTKRGQGPEKGREARGDAG